MRGCGGGCGEGRGDVVTRHRVIVAVPAMTTPLETRQRLAGHVDYQPAERTYQATPGERTHKHTHTHIHYQPAERTYQATPGERTHKHTHTHITTSRRRGRTRRHLVRELTNTHTHTYTTSRRRGRTRRHLVRELTNTHTHTSLPAGGEDVPGDTW